jgi:hypothetical protein
MGKGIEITLGEAEQLVKAFGGDAGVKLSIVEVSVGIGDGPGLYVHDERPVHGQKTLKLDGAASGFIEKLLRFWLRVKYLRCGVLQLRRLYKLQAGRIERLVKMFDHPGQSWPHQKQLQYIKRAARLLKKYSRAPGGIENAFVVAKQLEQFIESTKQVLGK